MDIKKTLTLSIFLHFSLFTAAFLLSADLSGGSSKMLGERVFLVKLIEDIDRPIIEKSSINTKKAVSLQSGQIKTEKKPVRYTQKEAVVAVETSVKKGDKENIGVHKSPESTLDNISFADNREPRIVLKEISAYTPSLQEGKGISESKRSGELPPGVIKFIENAIEKAKSYPLLARKRGIEGTVYISFRISPQGEPQDIKILKSSGSSILDKATLNVVKKAAPFPYIDNRVEVPVTYKLLN